MASTAEELSSQADQLQDCIAFFRMDERKITASKRETGTAEDRKGVKGRVFAKANGYKKSNVAVSQAVGADLDLEDGNDRIDEQFEKY
jgi:methyl-accepting chemotaxis protein